MKNIVNEKEILEALERQAFLIEQKFNKNILNIKELNENLPEGAMVSLSNAATLLPKYIYPSFLEHFHIDLNEVLKDPTKYIQKYMYPGDFERAANLVKLNLFGSNRKQRVSFTQRFNSKISSVALGSFTINSLVENNQEILGVSISLNSVGVITNKMLRILEETIYMRNNFHKFASLTAREKEIITLLALGYQNNEIGEQLFISKATVEQHRKNLKRKLEIKRFVDLIRFAQAFDLI